MGTGQASRRLSPPQKRLLYSCILDASNIAFDSDSRTPSLVKLIGVADDAALVATLREEYAVWNLVASSDADPELLPLLEAAEEREEGHRRDQFDQHLAAFRTGWDEFSASKRARGFRTMRNKLIAHREMRFVDGQYRAIDTTSLGLSYGDLKFVIADLQRLVDLATLLFRNASFDFPLLEEQVARNSSQLWAPSPAG